MVYTNKSRSDDKSDLNRIKKHVSNSYTYSKDNFTRYRDYKNYVFKESVNTQQKAMLQQLQRPVVEFNFLESDIDRLKGEFYMHEPSVNVSPAEGVPVKQEVVDIVEGHLRHLIYEADKNQFSTGIFDDMLSGGFDVAKVRTDFANNMSFKQNIFWERCFNPTLCGYDPMARTLHKGDGRYTFEIIPMTEEDFKETFPDVDIKVKYMRDFEEFNWAYKDDVEKKIILVADYYEKKVKKTQIYELADGRVMTAARYKKMKEYWEKEQFIEQFPVIKYKRWSNLEIICNYKLIEDRILSYEETDYAYLPHVWFIGKCTTLTQGSDNTTYEMFKPYVYHAKGIQDMVNFAGQTWCNAMESLIQHKFIIKKEAIPQERDYIEMLNNIQRAGTVVVNAYSENNPDKPIPEPIREVQNMPLPPEVSAAFQFAAQMKQTILGGFSSNLQKNDNDLSGKAVIEINSVGNAAAMPYISGYLTGLNQMSIISVDLMPKYILGARQLPTINKRGDKERVSINTKGDPELKYEVGALNVEISAGINFQVQKNQAVTQITSLMNASQDLSEFFNSRRGMHILSKNLTIYGADDLPEAIDEYYQQKEQQQQQAMQMQQQAMMQNPQMLRAQAELQKVKQQGQQQQIENQLDISRLAIEKELADAKILEAESKVTQGQIDSAVRLEEAQTSIETHALDSATKLAEIQSRHHQDTLKTIETHHKINSGKEAKE